MLKSYWKTAVRALLRNKTYGLINIVGLAAGTFCCLYILLYVRDQYSYDRHHTDMDDIYRVNRIDRGKDGEYNIAIISPGVCYCVDSLTRLEKSFCWSLIIASYPARSENAIG